MRYIFLIAVFLFLSGCAVISEGFKGVTGLSTRSLERTRTSAAADEFSCSLAACQKLVRDEVRSMGSYIYADSSRKNLIAIYVSENDTTPVGIFFTEVNADTTRIEVSSPSSRAKELISGRLFARLKMKLAGASGDVKK
jgi:hypothetical protein